MSKHPTPGQLRARVTIQREPKRDTTDNPYTDTNEGTSTENAWVGVRTVRAYVRQMKGSNERFFADQLESKNIFKVCIRKPRGIDVTASNRLIQKVTPNNGTSFTRTLQILSVVDRDDKHRWLDIMAEELGSKA